MASRLGRPILGVATRPRFVTGRRPPMQLTPTFLPLLLEFAGDFTRPTHATFVALMTGWLLSHRQTLRANPHRGERLPRERNPGRAQRREVADPPPRLAGS